jgi:hypothetical protein
VSFLVIFFAETGEFGRELIKLFGVFLLETGEFGRKLIKIVETL